MILAILNLYVTLMPIIKFRPIQLTVWEEILAILYLNVATMPSIKFWLNPTYPLGGDPDVFLRVAELKILFFLSLKYIGCELSFDFLKTI